MAVTAVSLEQSKGNIRRLFPHASIIRPAFRNNELVGHYVFDKSDDAFYHKSAELDGDAISRSINNFQKLAKRSDKLK